MIANTGSFLLPIALDDIYTIALFFVFLFIYSVTMFIIFGVLVCLRSVSLNTYFDKTSNLINLSFSNMGLAVVMSISLFSLGSIPPVAGFFGKYIYLLGILDFNAVIVALFIVLCSIFTIFVYLRLVKLMFFTSEKYS